MSLGTQKPADTISSIKISLDYFLGQALVKPSESDLIGVHKVHSNHILISRLSTLGNVIDRLLVMTNIEELFYPSVYVLCTKHFKLNMAPEHAQK